MFRFKTIFLFFIITNLYLPKAYSAPPSRLQFNMNTDWGFWRGDVKGGESVSFDESKWIPATIPHIMQLERKDCGGDVIYNGIGWYRRHFTIAPKNKGKKIWVSFEGVMTSCKVYLNGKQVAT